MKAIQIKYLPATNYKSSRIKAWTEAGSITKPYDHGFEMSDQARLIAQEYLDKYDWGTVKGFGQLPNGNYVATLGT